MGKAENFQIDMNDDVVKRAMVTYDGKINWPPEPLPVSPQKQKVDPVELEVTKAEDEAAMKRRKSRTSTIVLALIAIFMFLLANVAPPEFMGHLTVFVLAVFVGWQIIWNVSHSLHTPLMAVTNAISGIIIIGWFITNSK